MSTDVNAVTIEFLKEALIRIENKIDAFPCKLHGESLARMDEKICNMNENKLSWKEIMALLMAPIFISVLTTIIVNKL